MRRLVLVLPLLLALTACTGGDDDAASGPTLEERRAEYVAAAEGVCADANEEVSALPTPTSVDTVAPYAEQVVGVLDRTVAEVTALEPPEEDRAELTEKVLDPLRADVVRAREYAGQVRAAADAGDSAALLGLVSDLPTTSADVGFMREYGLTECASAADTRS